MPKSSMIALFLTLTMALAVGPAWAQGLAPSVPGLSKGPAVMPVPPRAPLGADLLPAPTWGTLSSAEHEALAPLSRQFDSLGASQRRKWKEMAQRFPSWPEDKRLKVQSRMLAWSSMTSEQRAAARQEAQVRRAAPSSTQSSESWRIWRELPDAERNELHNKAVSPGTAQ